VPSNPHSPLSFRSTHLKALSSGSAALRASALQTQKKPALKTRVKPCNQTNIPLHFIPSSAFAFVQVKRGIDEATLTGLELFMDFEGTSYKTTLRSPDANGMKRYVFNLTDMAANGKTPTYASVAPIFLERGRSFVGDITSNALMPFAKIVLNITELVLEIGQDEGDGDFVIVLNNSVLELDYDVCNPGSPVEDPWGGCAVSVQDMLNVTYAGEWSIYLDGSVESTWIIQDTYSIKFSGSDDCINNTYASGDCFDIFGGHSTDNYITLDDIGAVEEPVTNNACEGVGIAYIYEDSC